MARKSFAIYGITKHGIALAATLKEHLPDATFLPWKSSHRRFPMTLIFCLNHSLRRLASIGLNLTVIFLSSALGLW